MFPAARGLGPCVTTGISKFCSSGPKEEASCVKSILLIPIMPDPSVPAISLVDLVFYFSTIKKRPLSGIIEQALYGQFRLDHIFPLKITQLEPPRKLSQNLLWLNIVRNSVTGAPNNDGNSKAKGSSFHTGLFPPALAIEVLNFWPPQTGSD